MADPIQSFDTTYTITFSDGTKLENIRLNGDNYVSQDEVTDATFDGKLSTVTIDGSDGSSETLENAYLGQIAHYSDGYYFVLVVPTADELRQQKLRADIDYIALMSDVELEA